MAGIAASHHPQTSPRLQSPPTRPLGFRARHEVLVDLVIALAVLGFGVAVYFGQSEKLGWSEFRVVVVVIAALFGLGFLARAIRAAVQRRRFARIGAIERADAGDGSG